ncbi:hypothetical protein EYF80_031047 [Liparis tanakae]|uniref:Uncharacterized protein n=1 Tax=Liparis tanakae TaxID=230148 RepID=A0A4Z2H1F0_9TELE|nr:hypothetical protein EYF80_031047 [Liparis tanakae]
MTVEEGAVRDPGNTWRGPGEPPSHLGPRAGLDVTGVAPGYVSCVATLSEVIGTSWVRLRVRMKTTSVVQEGEREGTSYEDTTTGSLTFKTRTGTR